MRATIYFKNKNTGIKPPVKSFSGDAGFDLRASEDCTVFRYETKLVKTGLYFDIPQGYEIQVRSRSGMTLKNNVFVLNSPGTVDCNYKGEVGVILTNMGARPFKIKKGDRIAQAVVSELPSVELLETKDVGDSDRGSGGFGSTGIE